MGAPEAIRQLVKAFDNNLESYKNGSYKEATLRQEFINPFFKALGWDMANEKGYAPAYKEVVHEDVVKIGSATKAPDYSFRIGGNRKFFVEAKKPSVDIKDDAHPAYQLRRYAWNAKLPLSILTDFEEFAVYDCQTRPMSTDKADVGRIRFLTYRDYIDRWDEIANIFSPDAINKGSFDKFVTAAKGKRGTSTVDVELVNDIEKWRKLLAKYIARDNKSLSKDEINFAVQRTIDRILFLRMCEDRAIEIYGQLFALVSGETIYARLCQLFERADEKYNSGLFHFHPEKDRAENPDELTLNLKIDDMPLRWILGGLYYPKSPYEWKYLPPEVLGNVYEQFLGKVIRLTDSHQVKIEEKPEVKKAGGVYYTPPYIVDYIVKNTVGKLCENKSPKEIAKLRILDPACGSGSFMLGAYTYLLIYHRDWYFENDPAKYTKQIYQGKGGQWVLTIAEKKRILLNNIYGVDIDSQAVEVTKLSLLLKVLEGESQETIGQVYKMFHERALPDLGNNIKWGNSLISFDFYDNKPMDSLTEEQRQKINAFDWQKEFAPVFKQGGFDAVIGNPPWGADIDSITDYIKEHYPSSTQSYRDSFKLFMEKGLHLACRKGIFSFIIPSAFMFQPRYIDIRQLVKKFSILYLWNVGDKVFGQNVAAPCCVIVVEKNPPSPNFSVNVLDTSFSKDNSERAQIAENPTWRKILQSTYDETTEEIFVTFHRKLQKKEVPLEQVLDCKDCGIKHQRVGVGMEQKGKSDLASRLYYEGNRQSPQDHKYLTGSDLKNTGWFINYSVKHYFRANYKQLLHNNEIVYFNENIFDLKEKIVWRQTSDRIRATIIGQHWFGNTLQAGILLNPDYDLRYILGLLNSKFLNFIYIESVKETGRVFPQVKMSKVRALPFRTIDFSEKDDKAKHDKMVTLVEWMLDVYKKLNAAKVPDEKTKLQRQIDTTDTQIDKLVYDLYNLTPKEIEIVEGMFQQK